MSDIHRLDQVMVDAHLPRTEPVFVAVAPGNGDHKHGSKRRMSPHGLGDLVTAQARQVQIQNNCLRPKLVQAFQCRGPVDDRADSVPFERQELVHDQGAVGAVVDDKNSLDRFLRGRHAGSLAIGRYGSKDAGASTSCLPRVGKSRILWGYCWRRRSRLSRTREEILEFPGSVDGPWARYVVEPDARGIGTVRYPRLVPKDEDAAKALAKRTLTNLYNERPTWLDLAHKKLDAVVFDAYGWPADLTDDDLLARLLALNLERAKKA